MADTRIEIESVTVPYQVEESCHKHTVQQTSDKDRCVGSDTEKGHVAIENETPSSEQANKVTGNWREQIALAYKRWHSQRKLSQWIEHSIVVLLITILWALLAVMILVYNLPEESTPPLSALNLDTNTSSCSAEVYRGDTCRETLWTYQECHPDRTGSGKIYIRSSSSPTRDELEERAIQLLRFGLSLLNPSPECVEVIEPFLCLYLFGLCNSSGELYLPSSDECLAVRRDSCARDWEQFLNVLGPVSLPQCESLPETSLECSRNFTDSSKNGTSSSGLGITCSSGFFHGEEGVCVPECGEWSPLSETAADLTDDLLITFAIIGIIGGCVVMLSLCYNRMSVAHHTLMILKCLVALYCALAIAFKFPTVIILYQTVIIVFYEVIALIGITNRTSLFCSNSNLLKTDATPFCIITGTLIVYTLVQVTLWWFFHVVILFWGIKFPFHAKSFDRMGRMKSIHIAMVLTTLTVPFAAVGVNFQNISTARFSPAFLIGAVTDGDVFIYSLVLPVGALIVSGLSLLVIIFPVLIKDRRKWKGSCSSRVPAIKIFILISYHAVLLTTGVAATIAETDLDFGSLIAYFLCESTGIRPGKTCDVSDLASVTRANTAFLTLLLISPAVNLVYVVEGKVVKQMCACMSKYGERLRAASQDN